ncbi:MAG: GMC oxidoreductase [Solirubrobacteraceae bacterium]
MTAPRGTDWTRRAVITASIHPDLDTHVEFDNFGAAGDLMSFLFSALGGPGGRVTRPLKLVGQIVRHPRRFAQSGNPRGWSTRTLIVLVMQNLDNAISLKLKRLPGGASMMQTAQDPERPIPTHIPIGDRPAKLTAQLTGGIAQSSVSEALLGRPATAHILGGAVVGASPEEGVVDFRHRVFGYANLLVCDGAAVPGNPGVNPSLTITAMAERAMSFVPPATAVPAAACDPVGSTSKSDRRGPG